ncbi:hypothetical protein [Bradyrhizobium japonicum]|uniref:hypothetical protein n=1 Tax=Bradyrhizobium japonicum TaxID=375 RepID=UPI0027147FE0|nr:hypothetical protein [Bradyrhizobium japonicum]WLB23997.1 hypothetical protein QIH95_49505 [Bradyrhizobium japonicum]
MTERYAIFEDGAVFSAALAALNRAGFAPPKPQLKVLGGIAPRLTHLPTQLLDKLPLLLDILADHLSQLLFRRRLFSGSLALSIALFLP